jgi:hypothetical protein
MKLARPGLSSGVVAAVLKIANPSSALAADRKMTAVLGSDAWGAVRDKVRRHMRAEVGREEEDKAGGGILEVECASG